MKTLSKNDLKAISGGSRPSVAQYQLWLIQHPNGGTWAEYLRWWASHH